MSNDRKKWIKEEMKKESSLGSWYNFGTGSLAGKQALQSYLCPSRETVHRKEIKATTNVRKGGRSFLLTLLFHD